MRALRPVTGRGHSKRFEVTQTGSLHLTSLGACVDGCREDKRHASFEPGAAKHRTYRQLDGLRCARGCSNTRAVISLLIAPDPRGFSGVPLTGNATQALQLAPAAKAAETMYGRPIMTRALCVIFRVVCSPSLPARTWLSFNVAAHADLERKR